MVKYQWKIKDIPFGKLKKDKKIGNLKNTFNMFNIFSSLQFKIPMIKYQQ